MAAPGNEMLAPHNSPTKAGEPVLLQRELRGTPWSIEPPQRRVPVTFLLDDPCPGWNPYYFHGEFNPRDASHIPNAFLDRFAAVIERTGILGKFSVIPYPFGLGPVSGRVEGVTDHELAEWVMTVRERVAPYMDLSPELVTHWNALDITTETLSPFWEPVWVRGQSRETLAHYIRYGLNILDDAGLPANGVTSSWSTGSTNEELYAAAVGDALRTMRDPAVAWYFLHPDTVSRYVPPRLVSNDSGAAVVSIVCCADEFAWGPLRGGLATTDAMISPDGAAGRLVEACDPRGILGIVSHWQTLYSNGSEAGLKALETIAQRVNQYLGDRVQWMRCSAIAQYAAATKCITANPRDEGRTAFAADIACPAFTISRPHEARTVPTSVKIRRAGEARPLRRVDGSQTLVPDSWTVCSGRLCVCWDVRRDDALVLEVLADR